ncbi:hypothetical protein [Conchiformibius kuhniae]|uniref:Cytochrome C n=1 Tax=Conchiformibius kuhniae TaxID=211502 RepID=A0A8T9MVN3_9NEIS|nr:hypothetical protein [Conchiformibius kuhniae]UOP04915.1 cytochrome C [Conchiformibius kuhniae]
MKINKTVWLLAGVLAVAACDNPVSGGEGQGAQTSEAASQTVASQAAAAEPQTVELKSRDGVLTIKTAGAFADKADDEALRPEGIKPEQLILLQHNESDNITVYAADFGKAKHEAADYFAKLKKALESNKDLKDLRVETLSEARMDYRFSQNDANGDFALNESCAALVAGGQVYGVCASSPEISTDALAAVLNDINVRVLAEEGAEAASAAAASEASASGAVSAAN